MSKIQISQLEFDHNRNAVSFRHPGIDNGSLYSSIPEWTWLNTSYLTSKGAEKKSTASFSSGESRDSRCQLVLIYYLNRTQQKKNTNNNNNITAWPGVIGRIIYMEHFGEDYCALWVPSAALSLARTGRNEAGQFRRF